jgi:glycosyltransferase involved in cell wall biosynthesis
MTFSIKPGGNTVRRIKQRMKTIFAITRGRERKPSTRYRLLQYRDLFQQSGCDFDFVPKKDLRLRHFFKIARADAVIVQKAPMGFLKSAIIRRLAKKLIFEWDDALYASSEISATPPSSRSLHGWLKRADAVTCSNEHLAEYSRRLNKNVYIIPNAIDLEIPQTALRKPREIGGKIVLGWSGSRTKNVFLRESAPAIAEFLRSRPSARLRVMSDEDPRLPCAYEFIPWAPERENEFFERLDVGLLPLSLREFSKGKFPVTALLYMAYGLPVVATFVEGGPSELAKNGGFEWVKNNGWREALERAIRPETYKKLGAEALAAVQKFHDRRDVFKRWLALLENL